jgi:light-regulated signal transduction histidine kinase (bacteriophytochrome)
MNNALMLGQLIKAILAFSKLGRMELQKESVDPMPLVQAMLVSMDKENSDRNIEVRVDELPRCRADAWMLQQVYSNLLSNAYKYTNPVEAAEIHIRCLKQASKNVNFIRNHGVGFDMAYSHKLFGVFQRLHGETEFTGTGVGLANVKRISERHGGSIWFEAEPGKGAVFYFTLD